MYCCRFLNICNVRQYYTFPRCRQARCGQYFSQDKLSLGDVHSAVHSIRKEQIYPWVRGIWLRRRLISNKHELMRHEFQNRETKKRIKTMLRLRYDYSKSRLIARSQPLACNQTTWLAKLNINRATLVSREWGRSIAFSHMCFMLLDLFSCLIYVCIYWRTYVVDEKDIGEGGSGRGRSVGKWISMNEFVREDHRSRSKVANIESA